MVVASPAVALVEAQVQVASQAQVVDSPAQARAEEALLLLLASLCAEALLLLPSFLREEVLLLLMVSLPLPKKTGIIHLPEMLCSSGGWRRQWWRCLLF